MPASRSAEDYTRAEKVKHVKSGKQFKPHHCHWPGCKQQVPPAMWGCKKHWFRLPKPLRDEVWAAYRPGQEANLTPSAAYLKVARKVQQWIKDNYPEDWEFAPA